MIICQNCRHQELLGALFCSECGSRLDSAEGLPTDTFDPPLKGVPDQAASPPQRKIPLEGARVVLHPSDPTLLQPGDILVAPMTDPAWTPLFVPAAGVVAAGAWVILHTIGFG